MTDESTNRRDFLGSLKSSTGASGTGASGKAQPAPVAGDTIRLATRAMACEFSVILNPGQHEQVLVAGEALELVHQIETWLSIYQPDSDISVLNRTAADGSVHVAHSLFELLRLAVDLYEKTDRAFDIASGSQIRLWRECRKAQRIPTPEELEHAVQRSGAHHLNLDGESRTIAFDIDGLSLDPGAIGKGYALDQARTWLVNADRAPDSFLLHGGHSSLLAQGNHNGLPGWPVGIGNPLFTDRRLGTILLCDQAMSTSGSNIQFFRHQGQRYGHILDPRTARPVDGMLSVTVLADSAAVADAVSTAFFVLGVENALKCCDNLPHVGAILMPFPQRGRRVTPTVIGISPEMIFWDHEQVLLPPQKSG